MNKCKVYAVFIMYTIVRVGLVCADVPPSQQAEVEYLLQYVRTSSCVMERNGTRHDGQEAAFPHSAEV